mmetsp:Transcript_78698/g.96253  ORF Transcript_78698/g.96253 Transcript_78698/m.96253 type:complete len:116 (+) Transcript_78698:116-463(+)
MITFVGIILYLITLFNSLNAVSDDPEFQKWEMHRKQEEAKVRLHDNIGQLKFKIDFDLISHSDLQDNTELKQKILADLEFLNDKSIIVSEIENIIYQYEKGLHERKKEDKEDRDD